MARVAGDELVGPGFGRNQSVPIIVDACALDTEALRPVQTGQCLIRRQLVKYDLLRKSPHPSRALSLSEYHPTGISVVIDDFYSPASHRGEELGEQMQAREVLADAESAKNVR